jgi:hypothetical protein
VQHHGKENDSVDLFLMDLIRKNDAIIKKKNLRTLSNAIQQQKKLMKQVLFNPQGKESIP